MAQSTRGPLDERLLTHHPAGRLCLEICLAYGWQPSSADVLRLVRLWDEVRQGRRSDTTLSLKRLQFVKWLYQQGKIGEGMERRTR
jgi:hypothetical protein